MDTDTDSDDTDSNIDTDSDDDCHKHGSDSDDSSKIDWDERDKRDREEMGATLTKRPRQQKTYITRRSLADVVAPIRQEPSLFKRKLHMSEESLHKLVEILRNHLECDEKQSKRSTGGNKPINPKTKVACGVFFMGGTSMIDIACMFGISHTSVKRVVNEFIKAVENCEELNIEPPRTRAEFKKLADGFDKKSSASGIFYGVIGAIDGLLLKTERPHVPHALDYRSGHYQRFGLNVQAVCDSNLKFIYFATASPGKTNDARAYRRCIGLRNWIDTIPREYFLVGDNAYNCTEKLLIPYSGAERFNEQKLTYNFYLSQLRINIECAFALLTNKWRILKGDLECHVIKNAAIGRAAARLHNFVIDNDGTEEGEEGEQDNLQAIIAMSEREDGITPPSDSESDSEAEEEHYIEETSYVRRQSILDKVIDNGLQRPAHNIERNG